MEIATLWLLVILVFLVVGYAVMRNHLWRGERRSGERRAERRERYDRRES